MLSVSAFVKWELMKGGFREQLSKLCLKFVHLMPSTAVTLLCDLTYFTFECEKVHKSVMIAQWDS